MGRNEGGELCCGSFLTGVNRDNLEKVWRKFGVSVEKLRRACGMNALVLFYRISPDSDVFLADHSFISSPSHIFIQSAL
jgi:hypothetical protein